MLGEEAPMLPFTVVGQATVPIEYRPSGSGEDQGILGVAIGVFGQEVATVSLTGDAYMVEGVDVAVTKEATFVPVYVERPRLNIGSELYYAISVSNYGQESATGVMLTDALPEEVELLSVMAEQGNCSGTDTVLCDLGVVETGQSVAINLVVVLLPHPIEFQGSFGNRRTIANTATVTSNETDSNLANNSATVYTVVAPRQEEYVITLPKRRAMERKR